MGLPRKSRVSTPRNAVKSQRNGSCKGTIVYGVDFSGAADAGKKILVAECSLRESRQGCWLLKVVNIRQACDLPGGGVAPDVATAALCQELCAKSSQCSQLIAGIDSPPSIAKQFLKSKDWLSWVRGFARRYPSPDAFRAATSLERSACGATCTEPKRVTDVKHRTPFSPQNLRMYKQTWWAINGVFKPLAEKGFVVAPCMQMKARRPCVFEACPASVLKRLGLYSVSYKGTTSAHKKRRKELLNILKNGVAVGGLSKHRLLLKLDSQVLSKWVVDDVGADALDAVLSAVGAACATRRQDFPAPDDGDLLDIYKLEACVYC